VLAVLGSSAYSQTPAVSAGLSPATMARIGTVDERFQSAGSKTKCNTDMFIAEVLQCPRVTSI
jgi:hypothetical protein